MSVYNGMPLGPQSASWRTRTASSAYLRQAVESIIKQTYRNFEFIIVDDDSTDETWDYLKSLKDPRVKLIKNKKNLGLAASLNIALRQVFDREAQTESAQGDYIARMDADDISVPDRLKTQIDYLIKNPQIDICGTWVKLIDENNQIIGTVHKPTNDEKIKKMNIWITGLIHPTWLARREVFEKLNGYDTHYDMAEDYEFLIRAKNFKMANINEELLMWRNPQNRRSQKGIERMYRQSLAIRWKYFLNGDFGIFYLPFLIRSLITTYLFPTKLKIFLNKKFGLI
ncbi:hypothetical protein A3H26_01565 [candidate division WWE3 bacterium RIFCSPLOWO2_12_FULL_36_10]|uniref:Glycosyltransferase 2-like domain-containing protein n=1 Tax=candidate division WWE3 bacterium RIFCSPLOWO2_12_FULL_36_10 TaxID=1802630 RepID=A0A1F4VL52_UNCKA|nr:MAG: hypothetical protein A3H26_01565 [candidate division WWE3 bacterium RIFCSPLOWO2_12_FULL_36_10]